MCVCNTYIYNVYICIYDHMGVHVSVEGKGRRQASSVKDRISQRTWSLLIWLDLLANIVVLTSCCPCWGYKSCVWILCGLFGFDLRPPCYVTHTGSTELSFQPLEWFICTETMQTINRKDLVFLTLIWTNVCDF